jgi:hypothetical protein
MRKQISETRRQLAGSETAVRGEFREGMAATADLVAAIEKELASLTTAERRAPAYRAYGPPEVYENSVIERLEEAPQGDQDADRTLRPSLLVSPKNPGGRPVVRLNPEYFDRKLPPSAIQLIVLESWQGGDPTSAPVYPFELNLRQQLYSTLDWDAIRGLVKR